MAPPRKPRPAGRTLTPALATAALTSVALLSQTATAAPSTDGKPSLEEVEKKVDALYRQAGTATGNYNSAKEKTTKQKKRVDTLLDDAAERTEKPNEAREELGSFAAAQYRNGAASPDGASPLLADNPQDYADNPQDYFGQNQLMDRLTDRQKDAVDEYVTQQAEATEQRQEASAGLEQLTESQNTLKTSKARVQAKLAAARGLLSTRTAEEQARLAAIERREQEEADRRAEELARQQTAAQTAAQAVAQETQSTQGAPGTHGTQEEPSSGAETSTGAETFSPAETFTQAETFTPAEDSTYASKAAKALAFARAQIGKPYVWGGTGPGSYDCAGLAQAAWKAAGVDLPRASYDQVNAGTTVSLAGARPGDLVFFHDNISHVGLYIGNGMMIHAPKPGGYVREESVFYHGESSIHSVVRPA